MVSYLKSKAQFAAIDAGVKSIIIGEASAVLANLSNQVEGTMIQ
jgi:hypothetical protein